MEFFFLTLFFFIVQLFVLLESLLARIAPQKQQKVANEFDGRYTSKTLRQGLHLQAFSATAHLETARSLHVITGRPGSGEGDAIES